MRGTFESVTGSSVSRQAARIGSAPFLLPDARTCPESGCPPSITNDSAIGLTIVEDTRRTMLAAPCSRLATQAWETLTRYTKSEALLRHALAVEASTASYAPRFGEDEELWRVAALLHDFDYEIHPTLDKHPQDGAPILREEGYPEVVVDAVSRTRTTSRCRATRRSSARCSRATSSPASCTPAASSARPASRGSSRSRCKKKLKQPSFAAGVSRDDVYEGAELLELELDEHIANVVAALQPIAGELGLRT